MESWERQGRRLILIGAPLLTLIAGAVHPAARATSGVFDHLKHGADFLVGLHVVQLALFTGVGLAVWLLLRDARGAAASLAKLMLLIFLMFYPAFDALIGIGTGTLIQYALTLPPDQQAIVARLIDAWWNAPAITAITAVGHIAFAAALLAGAVALDGRRGPALPLVAVAAFVVYLVGAALYANGIPSFGTAWWWSGVVISTAAVLAVTATRPATALLAAAGLVFGAGHDWPFGPVGMACLLAAILQIEFARRPVPAVA